jgi:hypothetical protein
VFRAASGGMFKGFGSRRGCAANTGTPFSIGISCPAAWQIRCPSAQISAASCTGHQSKSTRMALVFVASVLFRSPLPTAHANRPAAVRFRQARNSGTVLPMRCSSGEIFGLDFLEVSVGRAGGLPVVDYRLLTVNHRHVASNNARQLRKVQKERNEKIWCGRVDSNHHGIATASPSSWCVCQFRHDRVSDNPNRR